MNLKVGLLTGFTERFEEQFPIGIISHNAPAMIASAHDVIDSTRILNTKFASHGANCGFPKGELSILLTDPFPFPVIGEEWQGKVWPANHANGREWDSWMSDSVDRVVSGSDSK